MGFEKVSDMMELCAPKAPLRVDEGVKELGKAQSQQAWRFRRRGLGAGTVLRLQREGCGNGSSSLLHPWSCFSDLD